MKFLSSTSRNLDPKDYAWDSVVHQFNRPLLDSELNLAQDLLNKKLTTPSESSPLRRQEITARLFLKQSSQEIVQTRLRTLTS